MENGNMGAEMRMAAEAAEAARAEMEASGKEDAAQADPRKAAPQGVRVPAAVAARIRNDGAEEGIAFAWRWASFLLKHGGPGYVAGLSFDEALDRFSRREGREEIKEGDTVVAPLGVFRVERLLETGDDELGLLATGHLEGTGTPVQVPAWGCVTYRPEGR